MAASITYDPTSIPSKPAVPVRAAAFLGLAGVAVFLVALFLAMSTASYDAWGALLVGPALFGLTVPILARQAVREGDRRLFWLLCAALVVKLGAGIAAHYVAYDFYRGDADVAGYHEAGVRLAEQFRSGHFSVDGPIVGTAFPVFLNGIIYTLIGPTKLGGFLVHSWLAFMGLYFFYRAFTIAVPEGRSRTYARLLFFLPTQVLWSSLMGKEPWMVLSLGIAAYGAARFLTGHSVRGFVLVGLGAWMATLIRPHIGGMIGVGIVVAALFRRPRGERTQLALVAKAASLVACAVVAMILLSHTNEFLRRSGVETNKGITRALQDASAGGRSGGSEFGPSILDSPSRAPAAVIAVLFRPFLTETDSSQAVAAALEGSFLLCLCALRIRWILAALRSFRVRPYITFALVYGTLFIIAFSSFANFGLLVRQRVQLLPFLAVMLSIPPTARPGRLRRAQIPPPATVPAP